MNKNVIKVLGCDEKSSLLIENGASSLTAPSNDQVWWIKSFDGVVCRFAPFWWGNVYLELKEII